MQIDRIRERLYMLDFAPSEMWEAIEKAYSDPKRHYHTLEHLGEMVDSFLEVAEGPGWIHPGEVAIALLYHDYVYDAKRRDNEQRSVQAAMQAIVDWMPKRIDGHATFRIHQLIVATTTHGRSRNVLDPDMGHFLDSDMAILGSTPERYAEYERQIVEEYSGVLFFKLMRKKFLCQLLALDPIYMTPFFRSRFEAAAKRNICASLGFERGFSPKVV